MELKKTLRANRNKLLFLAAFLLASLIAITVIKNTPRALALRHDAQSYYDLAISISDKNKIISHLIKPDKSRFIDGGYVTVLAVIHQLFGDKIQVMQFANYIFWFLSAVLIGFSLGQIVSKKVAGVTALAMLLSPLYLTFSAKLYSEPWASLGTSLIIVSMVKIFHSSKPGWLGYLSLFLGSYILMTTKSVFLLFLIVLVLISLYLKDPKALLTIFLVVITILPNIISSWGGGRSAYNLTIQSSKLEQSYQSISACTFYQLSYPLGKKLFPQYQGACHQNDPKPWMPGYKKNPYLIAAKRRGDGVSLSNTLTNIARVPIKYCAVIMSSMAGIVLVEGIYPSILLRLPSWAILPGYLVKIMLSSTLWILFAIAVIKNKEDAPKMLLYFSPLVYFIFVVGNFPVEQRYFYPLIPYLYFMAGIGLEEVLDGK